MLPFLRGSRFWTTEATRSAGYRAVTFIFIFLAGRKKTLIFFPRFCLAWCHGRSVLTNGWLVTRFCLMLIMKERNCHTCYVWFDYAVLIPWRAFYTCCLFRCSCPKIQFLTLPWNDDLPATFITSVFLAGVYTLDLKMQFWNAVRHIILCFHNYKERIIIITKFCLKPHDNYSTPFEASEYLYVKAVSHVTYDAGLLQYGHTHCDNQSFLPLPTEISQAKSPPTP